MTVLQSANERNHHIIHRLLEGATAAEKQALLLTQPGDDADMIGGGCISCDGVNEAEEWSRIRGAITACLHSCCLSRCPIRCQVLSFTEHDQQRLGLEGWVK